MKIKIPDKLRSVKTLPEPKIFMYDPEEPEYPDQRENPAAHARAVYGGGVREFYLLEPKLIGSADFHGRIWTVHETGARFLSATEAVQDLLDSGIPDKVQSNLSPGIYHSSYVSCSMEQDRVVLTQANGKQIIIKKA